MATVRCIVVSNKGVQCETITEFSEPATEKIRYICKNHTRAEQVRANGRSYDPTRDEADKDLRFQNHQFDKDLRRSSKPLGTSHIGRQGSETNDAPEGPRTHE